MRPLSLSAFILSVVLLLLSLGVAVNDRSHHDAAAQRAMDDEAGTHASTLDASMARARTITLIMAHNAAFRGFYLEPGSRASKLRRDSPYVDGANDALVYLESLFPNQIGELCFIDRNGSENARVVHGRRAPVSDLSPDEADNPFFAPTFALRPGQVFQSKPYVSPDTHDWVIGNATPIPLGAQRRSVAIVHYELSVESFRRELRADDDEYALQLVDAHSGRVIIDSSRPQKVGAPLGVPDDHRFADVARLGGSRGVTTVDGHVTAYRHLPGGDGNANDWILVAVARHAAPGFLGDVGPAPLAILAMALMLMTLAVISLRASRRELEAAATSDGLTGLANRRRLMIDLERRATRGAADPAVLLLFDLDGFKGYNDAFGHLAGDALLTRLGAGARPQRRGLRACLSPRRRRVLRPRRCRCDATRSSCWRPPRWSSAETASRSPRPTAPSPSRRRRPSPSEALPHRRPAHVRAQELRPRDGPAPEHRRAPARAGRAPSRPRGPSRRRGRGWPRPSAVTWASTARRSTTCAWPPSCTTWARSPSPTRSSTSPGRSTTRSGPSCAATRSSASASSPPRRHSARSPSWCAPATSAGTATAIPTGTAGEDIPLGARIVAVCDAYDAIVADRPYRRGRSAAAAMAELRRCAGTQFDPTVVAAFAAVLAAERRGNAAAAV